MMRWFVMLMVGLGMSLPAVAEDFNYSGHKVTVNGVPAAVFGGYDNFEGKGGGFSQDGSTYHFGKDGTVTVNWAGGRTVKADWGLVRTKDGGDFMRIKSSPGKPEFVGAYILAMKIKDQHHISKFYFLPDSNEIWETSARYQMMKKQ
ncbi:MAG: hypothetical protein VYE17_08640 [Pseudomonadota bacterium]|nr:hypothetical protein [Pseudomonadota bacterium]MEE2870584.1 hypothetical protein [Pseudomonadota bacterium]